MSNLQKQESPFVQIDMSKLNAAEGINIEELAFLGHLNVRGRVDNKQFIKAVKEVLTVDLKKIKPNTCVVTDDLKVFWLGPDEWLVLTPKNQQTDYKNKLEEALESIFSMVTDVSSGQTCLKISGEHARALLEKGCTIDLHPKVFKKLSCAQTHFAQATVLIGTNDVADEYLMVVRRSFSDYLGLWLEDACLEFV